MTLLHEKGYRDDVKNLKYHDLVWLAEYLDKALDILSPIGPTSFRKCLVELRAICGGRGILPQSYVIPSSHLKTVGWPIASSGPFNVYEGFLGDLKVCVKQLRNYSSVDPEWAKHAFCREAVVWKHLDHPNIVPLLGVTAAPFQFVTDWMPGGELPEYISTHQSADRFSLLSDVAAGLGYLHSRDVIHGDLKGASILVDGMGRARLTDFRLSAVTPDFGSTVSITDGHAARWAAPEILDMVLPVTKASDVYSFGMVMYEVLTGTAPFHDRTHTTAAVDILLGNRPERPKSQILTDDLWGLIELCWSQNPQDRPAISRVILRLRDVSPQTGRADAEGSQAADDATLSNFPRRKRFWFSKYETCQAATQSSPAKREEVPTRECVVL